MTKRKPVLVLFIITALLVVGGAALFALATIVNQGTELSVTFLDLNKGILDAFTSEKNMLTNILSVAISALLFVVIPFIVHILRKQHSVTVIMLLGALVALYVELLLVSYVEIKLPTLELIVKDESLLQELISKGMILLIGVGLLALSSVFELITFIVDMAIRVKKAPAPVPTAQEMREEPKAEEPAPAPAPAEEPAPVVEEPVKEEEPAPAEEPEEEEAEEPEEPEEEAEEEEAEEEPEPEEKPAKKPAPKKEEKKPAKKAEPKKAPAKKEEPKKAPAKKAEPKKEEKKPAPRETTTIKKPAARETQTIKKPEVLTNEEGKQFVKAYHVSQRKELKKWQVKGAGSDKAIKLFDTQKEAIEYANQLSANNGAAVRVHSRAGKMRKA